MTVRIEFFGMARHYAGIDSLEVDAETIQNALQSASQICPSFANACLTDDRLSDGYLMNHNGKQFTSSLETPLAPGDSLLILSSDMGG